MKRPIEPLMPNNAGLVLTTAGNDLAHTTSTGRKAIPRKVMWSNNTGAGATFQIGHLNNAGVFVADFPTITCVNGQHDGLTEADLPDVEFCVDPTLAPAGSAGNIIVVGSVAGLLVRMTLEERG